LLWIRRLRERVRRGCSLRVVDYHTCAVFGIIGKLIDVVQSWLSSSGGRSVKLELDGDVLEVTGITRGDQRELIRTWIDRHTDG
jgi:hypothetical protein